MSWAEIKKAINSNLAKPLNTLIDEGVSALTTLLGTKASQTSVTAVQTTANSILTRANLLPTSVVKSVQRGIFYAPPIDSVMHEYTVTIASVNMSNSLLIIPGESPSWYATGNTYGNYGDPINMSYLESATTIKINCAGYSTNHGRKIPWQVIEFY